MLKLKRIPKEQRHLYVMMAFSHFIVLNLHV